MSRETYEILMWTAIVIISLFVIATVTYICVVLIIDALRPLFNQIKQEGLKSIFESIWYGKDDAKSFMEIFKIGA